MSDKSIRTAAANGESLGGADAQALEGALQQVERELAQRDAGLDDAERKARLMDYQLRQQTAENATLRAAIATPECYAGVISEVVERERDAAVDRYWKGHERRRKAEKELAEAKEELVIHKGSVACAKKGWAEAEAENEKLRAALRGAITYCEQEADMCDPYCCKIYLDEIAKVAREALNEKGAK